jgi:hypothetical protein
MTRAPPRLPLPYADAVFPHSARALDDGAGFRIGRQRVQHALAFAIAKEARCFAQVGRPFRRQW